MTASFGLVAGLACALLGQTPEPAAVNYAQDVAEPVESASAPKAAASLITDVTVYQGQALVTREVSVPAGEGTVELVVTPLPAHTVDSSLYTEGAAGLRVLSTRFRTRAVQDDTRQEVRTKEALINKLEVDAQRLQKQIAVEQEDLSYIAYTVKNGLLTITSSDSAERETVDDEPAREALMGGMGGGMGGGSGSAIEQFQASSGARLNREAATDQAEELRVTDRQGLPSSQPEKDSPSVTFSITGRLDVPSRRDPQLLEVARVELPAEYYAKAVPVLTPRVYRLAKLTNKSDVVLLPGEATVYVGGDFVGRMRLPLVAAGEPFIAGFGADPQLQVSRRLVLKSRSVQGGNQIFDYEFRIGLRNYRPSAVKLQLWDRLPKPQGEAVAVNLVKTSAELSNDSAYQRTSRTENLLRWDIDVPRETIGDKTMYLNYEFRLEYARDLPQPQFVSGGLREGPIGGGAMGMGGMGAMR